MFVISKHGKDELNESLYHSKNRHPTTKFTLEIKKNYQLTILDLLVYEKEDSSIGHPIYSEKTHTNRDHLPVELQMIKRTPVTRSQKVPDTDSHEFLTNI